VNYIVWSHFLSHHKWGENCAHSLPWGPTQWYLSIKLTRPAEFTTVQNDKRNSYRRKVREQQIAAKASAASEHLPSNSQESPNAKKSSGDSEPATKKAKVEDGADEEEDEDDEDADMDDTGDLAGQDEDDDVDDAEDDDEDDEEGGSGDELVEDPLEAKDDDDEPDDESGEESD